MTGEYSRNSRAIKRIQREVQEIYANPSDMFSVKPLDDNIFEWHFTICGQPDSDFQNGLYHGRIILPPKYPFEPPNFEFLTPNGRFKIGEKICLSITSYHEETWQPSWTIRTALIALIAFMTTDGSGAIGAIEAPSNIRANMALKSRDWFCKICQKKNDEDFDKILHKETKNSTSTEPLDDSEPEISKEEEKEADSVDLVEESDVQTENGESNAKEFTLFELAKTILYFFVVFMSVLLFLNVKTVFSSFTRWKYL